MPINNTDLTYRRAALLSDEIPAQNGGRMTGTAITTAVKNNLFPDTRSAERTNGSDLWRKLFIHVASTGNEQLMDASASLQALTNGDDYVLLYPGTATDTQDGTSTARPYGIGTVSAAEVAGATSLSVTVEGGSAAIALNPIRAGDTLRLSPASSPVDVVIDTVTPSGNVLSLTLSAPLAADVAAGTIAASVLPLGNVQSVVSTPVKTSDAGTLSSILGRNKGAVEQSWTITFTSATAYRLDGDTLGASVATGSTTADFSPNNSAVSAPYFHIPASSWGGTWATGDTVTFTTTAAAAGLWLRRVTPAGAAATVSNGASVLVMGESE